MGSTFNNSFMKSHLKLTYAVERAGISLPAPISVFVGQHDRQHAPGLGGIGGVVASAGCQVMK